MGATIGLEVSACTGNARRTSLEQVLRLAYPGTADAQLVEDACTKGDFHAASALLRELEKTGITNDKRCILFWPLSSGIPEGYHLKQIQHAWLDLLKDSCVTGCFAVLSPSCLTYVGQDQISKHILKKLCSHNSHKLLPSSILQTEINFSHCHFPPLGLKAAAKVRLRDGHLEIRNTDKTRLALYKRYHWVHRAEMFSPLTRHDREGHRYSEVVDPDRKSVVASVCILDAKH